LTRTYEKLLAWALRRKYLVLVLATGFFIGTLMLLPLLRKEFIPVQDQSMFLARLKTPVGSSMAYTNERFLEAEALVTQRPEVRRYLAAVGGFGGGGQANQGNLFVTLLPKNQRPRDPKTGKRLSQQEIMGLLRKDVNAIPTLKASFQDLSSRGFAAQRGYPVEFTVRGPEWEKLVDFSQKIEAEMQKSDLFQDVDTDYLEGMPEIRIKPDRDKAFEHGVSVSTIAGTINALIAGEVISKYTRGGRRYDVRIRVNSEQRSSIDDIAQLKVRNNRGELVQLSDVISIEEKPSLLTITRRGRERAIGIFANVPQGVSQADSLEKTRSIARSILPAGYHLVFSGTSETFHESFSSLIFALWLGVLVAYMVLASQFNHIIHPFVVLLALPFSISGALLALWAGHQSINIFSMIGLLLLMGIVKKNSILLVEFTNQLREEGEDVLTALQKACPIRFRPVIMTSVSTMAAALPPALALGPGSETRVPMALAILGGVAVSTLLTLLVVPCAYQALAPLNGKWFHALFSKKKVKEA